MISWITEINKSINRVVLNSCTTGNRLTRAHVKKDFKPVMMMMTKLGFSLVTASMLFNELSAIKSFCG